MCSYAGVLLCLCDRIIAGLQRCAFTSKHACVYVDVRSPEITMPVQTHRVCVCSLHSFQHTCFSASTRNSRQVPSQTHHINQYCSLLFKIVEKASMSRGAGPALSNDTEELLTCSLPEGFERHARHTQTK